MFFADDLILFGYANIEQATFINEVLEDFSFISGQEISRDKSRVYFSKNTSRTVSRRICEALDIQATQNLGRYLGVPIIHGRNSKDLYNYIIDRMEQRLAGWKVNSLSMAGRVALAKSVLNTLPTYAMQTTLLPTETCNLIDKKIRDFIWGSTNGARKIHQVNWDTICSPKEHGGLGLRSATELNEAFLMKLIWGIIKKPTELWVKVLKSKYLKDTPAGLLPRKTKIFSSCWRGINNCWEKFRGGLRWGIRNGRNTNFWNERWLDSGKVLAALSPPPAGMESMTIADACNDDDLWNVGLLATFLPFPILQEVVGMTPPSKELEDDIPVWGLEPNGVYSVKSGYILAKGLVGDPERDRWNKVWKWEGPQRVRHFLWIVSSNKLLTNAERHRRHMTACGDCGVCAGTPETSIHILRDCATSQGVWNRFREISNQPNFFTTSMEDWWNSNLKSAATATKFGVICWVLWKCRNERIFEGTRTNVLGIEGRCRYWIEMSKEAFGGFQILRGNERPQRHEANIYWEAGPTPGFTLNTDGSVSQPSGTAAAGGVIRNWEGRVVDAFTMNLGKCSITRAELTGAVTGLERAWELGVRELTVQLDSLCAVRLISDLENTDHQHACIVKRFKALMNRAWRVRVTHIYREGNFLADYLASKGHTATLGLHPVHLSDAALLKWAHYDRVGGFETRRIVS
ncbi:Putative ribonuclease H protein At1g65750 [Linum perenne]